MYRVHNHYALIRNYTATKEDLLSLNNTVVQGMEEARKTTEENKDLKNSLHNLPAITLRDFGGRRYAHVAKQVNFTEAEVDQLL